MKTCNIKNCDRKQHGRGYCAKHVRRLQRYGDPTFTKIKRTPQRTCTLDGCDKRHKSRGLCSSHYMMELRRGGYRWDPNGTEPSGVKGNTVCEKRGCDDTPMGGGRFCLLHFRTEIVEPRRTTGERHAA